MARFDLKPETKAQKNKRRKGNTKILKKAATDMGDSLTFGALSKAMEKMRSGSLKDRLEARDLVRAQGGRPSDKDFKTATIKKLQGSKPSSGRKALIKKVKKLQGAKPSSTKKRKK